MGPPLGPDGDILAFAKFERKYLSSMPVKVAGSRFDFSVGTPKLEDYLRTAFQKKPKNPPPPPVLPEFVRTVLHLQEEDGRWDPSPALHKLLGGFIPDPPEAWSTIQPWKWTTALVVVMLRRECVAYVGEETLTQGYARASTWVTEGLLRDAREVLPPRNAYFKLNQAVVKAGRWRDCAQQQMDAIGYLAFVSDEMRAKFREEHAGDDGSLASSVTAEAQDDAALAKPAVAAWRIQRQAPLTAAQERREKREKLEKAMKRQRAREREAWRQDMLALEFRKLAQVPRDEQQRRLSKVAKDLTPVHRTWAEQVITDKEEMERLQQFRALVLQPQRKPWLEGARAVDFFTTKNLPLARVNSQEYWRGVDMGAQPRKRALPAATVAELKAEELIEQAASKVEEEARGPERGETRVQAEARIIKALLAMEQYLVELKGCLERCTRRYRTCRLQRDRLELLDEVTAMLGHPQPPRKGFQDWRGKGFRGMHAVLCDVIEAVGHWRQAIFQEQVDAAMKLSTDEPNLVRALELKKKAEALTLQLVPFYYNGSNILLQLPYIMEFLGDIPEVVAHYGTDFRWKRNPFLRGITLDERAPTPRKATRRVFLEGVPYEEVVESLLELRKQDEENIRIMEAKLAKAGFWWPGIEARPEHIARIRAAEKALLLEEKVHGRLQFRRPRNSKS